MTLMEALIGITMSMIIMLSVVSLVNFIHQSSQQLMRKSDSLNLKAALMNVIQETANCTTMVNPNSSGNSTNPAKSSLVFDATKTDGSQSINVQVIWIGNNYKDKVIVEAGQTLPSGLGVTSVKIENLKPTDPASLVWRGDWTIKYGNTAIQDTVISTSFYLDSNSYATHPTSVFLDSCMGQNNLGPIVGCPAGWSRMGMASALGTFCIENTPRSAKPLMDAKLDCASVAVAGFGPAHLCKHREWFATCKQNLSTVNQMPSPWEIIDNFDEQYYIRVGGAAGGCNSVDYASDSTPNVYRCCL